MKFVPNRPFADPEAAARKQLEFANAVEPVQDGRIHIEKINWPFLSEHKGSVVEYCAGLKFAIEKGWLDLHESETYVKLTDLIRRTQQPRQIPPNRAFTFCSSIPVLLGRKMNGATNFRRLSSTSGGADGKCAFSMAASAAWSSLETPVLSTSFVRVTFPERSSVNSMSAPPP
jgi:hypothetical protein